MEGEEWREVYMDCMKNYVVTMGVHVTDGCREFIQDETRPGLLLCGACGCHRSFHRRLLVKSAPAAGENNPVALRCISPVEHGTDGRRRPRTKFTVEQKAKMGLFSEKVGWRIPAKEPAEEGEVAKFCQEIGVSREVLKVWMHNHKKSSASTSGRGKGSVVVDDSPAME